MSGDDQETVDREGKNQNILKFRLPLMLDLCVPLFTTIAFKCSIFNTHLIGASRSQNLRLSLNSLENCLIWYVQLHE